MVKPLVSYAGIDDILLSLGCRFQWVIHSLPGQFDLVVVHHAECQVVNRKRLYHVGCASLGSDETEHPFVDGTAHGEAEAWVEAVAHVGKVLVREQLQQHGRHTRHAGLEVGLVPHASAAPKRFVECAHVIDDGALYQVCEVPA